MSLDSKKLKKILEKHDIMILEYFCVDRKCAFIKCFLNKICDFLLIYIPSKLRFGISENDKRECYEVEEFEDHTELDDYSKSSKIPDMENIDEEKSSNSYQELSKKYKTSISLEGSEEPIPRKLKRQIERLKSPFSRLSYDLALFHNKYLYAYFGNSLSMFLIKGYNKPNRTISYLINVNELIEKIEDISPEIETVKKQFYEIIKKVSLSNLENISTEINDYDKMVKSIHQRKKEFEHSLKEYQSLFNTSKEKESTILSEFKQSVQKQEDNIKKIAIQNSFQKTINELFLSKNEIIKKGIQICSKFQKCLLIYEEISFDNSVMIDRIKKNFMALQEIL